MPPPSPSFRLLASSVPRRSAHGPWGGTTVAVGRNWEAAAAVGGGDSEVGTRRCHGVQPRSRETGKRRRHRVGSGFERGRVASRRASAAVVGAARQTPLTWGATMRPLVVILFLLFCDLCVSGYAIRFFVMKFLTFTHSICFFSCLAGHRWRAMCQEAGTVC
jgi:hypothetical protein